MGLGLPKEQAECAAEIYVDSDLSKEYLRALADGKQPKASIDDQNELANLSARMATECLASK